MSMWPQDCLVTCSSRMVVFTLSGFEQSHVQNPGIDSNYCVYNGDYFLMPGKEVNGRPVFENHNNTGWTHRYFIWHDGYWRGCCGSGGSPHRKGDAPWDDAKRWNGDCDMLVKSSAMHPNAIDSSAATWMVYKGATGSSDPSDFLPVCGVTMWQSSAAVPIPDFRPFGTRSHDAVYCMDGNVKRWYPNPAVYGSYFPGPDWSQITYLSDEVVAAIPSGPDMPMKAAPDGFLGRTMSLFKKNKAKENAMSSATSSILRDKLVIPVTLHSHCEGSRENGRRSTTSLSTPPPVLEIAAPTARAKVRRGGSSSTRARPWRPPPSK